MAMLQREEINMEGHVLVSNLTF